MPASPLSPEQKAEAAALKVLFKEWQAQQKVIGVVSTQEQLTDILGFGQSAMSQYLNGRIPLNPKAAAKFATLLGCEVRAFSPTIAAQIAAMTPAPPVALYKTGALPAAHRVAELQQTYHHEATESEWQMLLEFRDISREDREYIAQEIAARAEKYRRLRREVMESLNLPPEAPPTSGEGLPVAPRARHVASKGHRLVKVQTNPAPAVKPHRRYVSTDKVTDGLPSKEKK